MVVPSYTDSQVARLSRDVVLGGEVVAHPIIHTARRAARRTLIAGNGLLLLSAALPWAYYSSPYPDTPGAGWSIPLLSIIWGIGLRHPDDTAPWSLILVGVGLALTLTTVALLRRPDHPMQEFTRGMLVILALIALIPTFALAIAKPYATGFSSTPITASILFGGLVALVGLGCVIFGALFFAPAQTLQQAK
jgi:hypothetical protein